MDNLLIIYSIIALCWLIGSIAGLWLVCIGFVSFLDRMDSKGVNDGGMIIEHEGEQMSLKYWYDNFIDCN
jgi:hypothetical protein